MQSFFYICEYFNITPQEFFDEGNSNPQRLREFMNEAKKLNANSLSYLLGIMKELNKSWFQNVFIPSILFFISALIPTALSPRLSGTMSSFRFKRINVILSYSLASFSKGNRMMVGVLKPTPSSNNTIFAACPVATTVQLNSPWQTFPHILYKEKRWVFSQVKPQGSNGLLVSFFMSIMS